MVQPTTTLPFLFGDIWATHLPAHVDHGMLWASFIVRESRNVGGVWEKRVRVVCKADVSARSIQA